MKTRHLNFSNIFNKTTKNLCLNLLKNKIIGNIFDSFKTSKQLSFTIIVLNDVLTTVRYIYNHLSGRTEKKKIIKQKKKSKKEKKIKETCAVWNLPRNVVLVWFQIHLLSVRWDCSDIGGSFSYYGECSSTFSRVRKMIVRSWTFIIILYF